MGHFLLPCTLKEGELGSQRDRKGSYHPRPWQGDFQGSPLNGPGWGEGMGALAGRRICLKSAHLRNTFVFPPGAEESLPRSLRRRWIPRPRALHLTQLSPQPRLPPSLSHSLSHSGPEQPENPARK